MSQLTTRELRLRRHRRVRGKVRGTAERPRLAVFRSNKGIFAQLVDDDAGKTLAAASWQMGVPVALPNQANLSAAGINPGNVNGSDLSKLAKTIDGDLPLEFFVEDGSHVRRTSLVKRCVRWILLSCGLAP